MEWAGAFGDLGTLIPFVVAYIGMVGMDPFAILFAFGVSLIVCGAFYRTLAAGVLRKSEDGRIEFPFDAMHVDFVLKAA